MVVLEVDAGRYEVDLLIRDMKNMVFRKKSVNTEKIDFFELVETIIETAYRNEVTEILVESSYYNEVVYDYLVRNCPESVIIKKYSYRAWK